MNYDRDQSRRYVATRAFEELPTLGQRPGLVLFPWRRLLVGAIGLLIVVIGALLAR